MPSKKCLVVFYSRSGTTRKAAEAIAKTLNAEIEELIDLKNRSGPLGYLLAGKDASQKALTKIKPLLKNPANFDLVIVGTPIWAGNIAPAVRTFLSENSAKLKKAGFFCTHGGDNSGIAFKEMEALCGKKPIAATGFQTREVVQETACFKAGLEEFAQNLKRQ